jgi:Domain of unknown function (DUF4203)
MLPAAYATPAAATLLVGGLLACFVGYRLFRVVLGVYGFIFGAAVTTTAMGASHTMVAIAAAGLVGGLVGAGLMVAAYFVGVGLVGAGLALLALNAGWHAVAHVDPPTLAIAIVAVLGALAALSIVRYVVVFGTALSGSWTAILGGLALTGNQAAAHAASAGDVWVFYPLGPPAQPWWVPIAWIGLGLVGVVVQLATTSQTAGSKKKVKKT